MLKLDGATAVLRASCALRFAFQGLLTAPQRALLASIGVLIGVASVVALVSLGKSMEHKVLAEFAAMGTQVVSVSIVERDPVSIGLRKPYAGVRPKNLDGQGLINALLDLPEVEIATELTSVACQPQGPGGSQRARPAEMLAVRPQLLDIVRLKLERGRFLHSLDGIEPWVVLGAEVARQLQATNRPIEPGAVIMLCGRAMQVAGVMAPMSMSEATVPLALDHGIFVSTLAAARIERAQPPSNLLLRLRSDVSPVTFAPRLQETLAALTGNEVQITTAQKVIELRSEQTATYARYLTALSGISLLVGALGILNIMLMAVMERRREIGLRLAVGADDIDIALQFLFESMLLSLAGGGAGTVLGVLTAAAVAVLAQLPFVLSLSAVGIAMVVSLVIGAASGLYPALKAARLEPVHTLQSPG